MSWRLFVSFGTRFVASRVEDDEAPVRRDLRVDAVPVRLRASGRHAEPPGPAGRAVAQEDVRDRRSCRSGRDSTHSTGRRRSGPLAEMAGSPLEAFACASAELTLTRFVLAAACAMAAAAQRARERSTSADRPRSALVIDRRSYAPMSGSLRRTPRWSRPGPTRRARLSAGLSARSATVLRRSAVRREVAEPRVGAARSLGSREPVAEEPRRERLCPRDVNGIGRLRSRSSPAGSPATSGGERVERDQRVRRRRSRRPGGR